MEFRYDFASKTRALDLTRFKRQAPNHIKTIAKLNFLFLLNEFKVVAEVETPAGSHGHSVTVYFFEVTRDKDFDITSEKAIIPLVDTRFKELTGIKEIFTIDHYKAHFDSSNAQETVDKLCNLLRIVHKINQLLIYL
ncbi:unnamed protein product [Sphagnum balticum]